MCGEAEAGVCHLHVDGPVWAILVNLGREVHGPPQCSAELRPAEAHHSEHTTCQVVHPSSLHLYYYYGIKLPVVSKVVRRAAHLAPSGPKAEARPACASLDRAPSPAIAKGLFEKLSEPSTVGRAAGSVTTTNLLPDKEYLNH